MAIYNYIQSHLCGENITLSEADRRLGRGLLIKQLTKFAALHHCRDRSINTGIRRSSLHAKTHIHAQNRHVCSQWYCRLGFRCKQGRNFTGSHDTHAPTVCPCAPKKKMIWPAGHSGLIALPSQSKLISPFLLLLSCQYSFQTPVSWDSEFFLGNRKKCWAHSQWWVWFWAWYKVLETQTIYDDSLTKM